MLAPVSKLMMAAAGFSLMATPVMASDIAPLAPQLQAPAPELAVWSPADDTAQQHRRYRRHRDDGIDAGDVIAGALIIGGIAAIAGAVSNSERERRAARPYARPYDGAVDYTDNYDAAADQCSGAAVSQAGYSARVERITAVARDGSGWRVEGDLASDRGLESFLCGVTAGRIDYLQLGQASGYQPGYAEPGYAEPGYAEPGYEDGYSGY